MRLPHEQSPEQMKVTFADGSSTDLTALRTGDPGDPVILCLPAMGIRVDYYEVLGDVLVEYRFNTVLADLRGSGGSSVRSARRVSFGYAEILEMELPDIVEAVCQKFGADQIIVLGHSLGGQLGLLFAATSTRVSHVILVASGSAWYRRVPGMRSVGWFLGLQLIFGTTLLWGYLPDWFPFAGRETRHLIRDWGFESMTGRYRISHSSVDYEKALSVSTVPSLFVTFPADPYVPSRCGEHLAAKLKTAQVMRREIPPELLRLVKTDHFRWVSRPQAVVKVVAEWIAASTKSADC